MRTPLIGRITSAVALVAGLSVCGVATAHQDLSNTLMKFDAVNSLQATTKDRKAPHAPAPVSAASAVAAAMTHAELKPYKAEITAAEQCLDDFLKAFNARDIAAYDATFNFPSVRLASNTLRIINAGDQKASLFTAGSLADWDHTAWQRREVLHAGPDKVHINTRFARYRKDGSLIGAFDSIYVVTKENGHWGIKARSSFAP